LIQYGRTQPRLDCIDEHQVDGTPKSVFQEKLQVHVSVKRRTIKLHEKVKVARFGLTTDCNGPEKTKPSNA